MFRRADSEDATQVAGLHADSWRRHYRGAYADEFLDSDVLADRLSVWAGRLDETSGQALTVVSEVDGDVIGFVHVILDADPTWGALVDNLHVRHDHQGQGIGRRLMAEAAAFVAVERPESALHLWVLEQNEPAQRFYRRMNGRQVEAARVPPVGGISGRLDGTPVRLRFVWAEPRLLGTSPRR